MKQILNNTLSLARLHNIMKACRTDEDLSQYIFEVYYRSFGSDGCPTLAECRELVQTRQVVRAAEYTQLPWDFFKSVDRDNMAC